MTKCSVRRRKCSTLHAVRHCGRKCFRYGFKQCTGNKFSALMHRALTDFLYVLENYNDIIGLDYSDKTYSGSIISDKSKNI